MITKIYQRFLSPLHHLVGRSFLGTSYACRFSPTCSVYISQAVNKYGIIHGSLMGLKRFLRCHPFSSTPPFDPVP